jgi:hypothetical protein
LKTENHIPRIGAKSLVLRGDELILQIIVNIYFTISKDYWKGTYLCYASFETQGGKASISKK